MPAAKLVGDKSYSILTDHLGTPYEAYDENGEKVWARELDLYGNAIAGDSSFIPFLYQGQYYDEEIGLAYNCFRYYSPDSGTYISQDPIGLAGNNPNFYGYVKDTNIYIDIFGLLCWSAARRNFWIQEANNNLTTGVYSQRNLSRMQQGLAPQMTVEVTNRRTGVTSIMDVSLELHHTHIPQRVGGTGVHNSSNLTIVTPWEHEAIDPYRHVGYDLENVISDVSVW